MFKLFKRKKNDSVEIIVTPEREEEKKENSSIEIGVGYTAT